jgi:hypothetical protein
LICAHEIRSIVLRAADGGDMACQLGMANDDSRMGGE